MAERAHPSILTITGDNALSIGIMGGTLYVGALLLVQIVKRFAGASAAPAPAPASAGVTDGQ